MIRQLSIGFCLALVTAGIPLRAAAKNFEFERAASIRDRIRALKQRDLGVISATELPLPS